MNTLRKIIHIDMDAFFASVEQLDSPHLRGKPVIVGGNPEGRGVVAACSYEARQYGIHSAMPCSRAVKLCPNAIFTRPRMERYREISHIIMNIFSHYTELIEQISVDEAYLDVTVNRLSNPSAIRLAEIIRQRIFSETGLTASAGVSYNKFLAKVASDLQKPNGLSVILPQDAVPFLDRLPVGKFHGVGKVTENKMHNIGIRTGRDLRQFTEEDLLIHFGKSGSFFYNIVRGIDDRAVRPTRERKSIGSETTLQRDIIDSDTIYSLLRRIAEKISASLKKRDMAGSTVTLKVRYHDFTTITRSITLKSPVDSSEEIFSAVQKLTSATSIGKRKVRLLGISISKLIDRTARKPVQLRLPFIFDDR